MRETWRVLGESQDDKLAMFDGNDIQYRADSDESYIAPYRPSIFMPRCFSRITLEVIKVRVQRLQEISAADATAEGVYAWRTSWDQKTAATMFLHGTRARVQTNDGTVAQRLYMLLWEQINGYGSWDKNPWVWAIRFKRVDPCAS